MILQIQDVKLGSVLTFDNITKLEHLVIRTRTPQTKFRDYTDMKSEVDVITPYGNFPGELRYEWATPPDGAPNWCIWTAHVIQELGAIVAALKEDHDGKRLKELWLGKDMWPTLVWLSFAQGEIQRELVIPVTEVRRINEKVRAITGDHTEVIDPIMSVFLLNDKGKTIQRIA